MLWHYSLLHNSPFVCYDAPPPDNGRVTSNPRRLPLCGFFRGERKGRGRGQEGVELGRREDVTVVIVSVEVDPFLLREGHQILPEREEEVTKRRSISAAG